MSKHIFGHNELFDFNRLVSAGVWYFVCNALADWFLTAARCLHYLGNCSEACMLGEVLQQHGKPSPPVRVFMHGAGQIDLLLYSEKILTGDDQEPRRRIRKISRDCRKLDGSKAALLQGMS